ncbi:Adenosylmethionine-8-amino-7-oxononanoate aminotransferase [BD1-7 clade bacterium]|uniref:Adenosylmethionine-8-amino-7-oxononanoate aminotransferase n=1 Tax=BD1-7 clade bacterium TaxID=2029982 RepID=A0A5S9QH96_9GAMM|nr:Adenosylmethionine-8-amino-7-oxononanoate aminotransferase [BD1-7 clade bacterium]CAA0116902.1 Adenosylmethionine-8-amino-7-oxononanoate aminotransferase [BD1-7 clade bacterium]
MSDPTLSSSDLIEFDKKHLWHPYTSMTNPSPMYVVESADGVRIRLDDGRELIDGMASWWSVIHGYNHPALNAAIENQLNKMAHVMFGGLTHQPAVDLGRKLVEITPPGLEKVFYADSGSVAVEVAIKMAVQYWLSQGESQKTKLVSLRNGYHGDTFGAMAVTDPDNGMHHLFKHTLAEHLFTVSPGCDFASQDYLKEDVEAVEALFFEHHQDIAALILEPIVQGAGGMKFYSPAFLKRIRALCDHWNILLIADEIATGFGRTGELFACTHAGITPDILTLGKAITGGYMSFAAALCTERVAIGISEGEAGVLMHGPTFMANPMACAVSLASIDLLLSKDWKANIQRIKTRLESGLAPAKALPQVADVRVLGAIGVIELKQPVDMQKTQAMLVDEGVWVRPFGKLLYVMPPYVMDNDDLNTLTTAMIKVASQQ